MDNNVPAAIHGMSCEDGAGSISSESDQGYVGVISVPDAHMEECAPAMHIRVGGGNGSNMEDRGDDTTCNAFGISHGLLQGSGGSPQQFMQEVDILSGPDEYVDDEGPSMQVVCGDSMTSYQQRLECRKAAILDRICPGIDNELLLSWFISCHFDEVYTLYFAFLRWRDIYLAEFPTAVVHVRDWQRANAS